MSEIAALVSDHLDIWIAAVERKNGAGRGGGKRVSLYGIDRLRALILNYAVRGKLVSQDADDEPASEFLRRIRAKQSDYGQALPAGWAAVSLEQLGTFFGGMTPSKNVSRYWGSGMPWVSPKDMGDDRVERSEDQITQAALEETSLQVVPEGSLVMVARSGILRRKFPVAITSIPCTLNQDMKALVIKHEVEAQYLQLMLRGFQPRILSELVKRGMTVESLIFRDFVAAPWPIPPLAEQRRIVAKVDELMALCDALEGESAAALAAHQTLVETLLATLAGSSDTADVAANWHHLETHFDTLFTTEASVDALRQTVLELAVRGRLVERDQGEDPASDLITGWQNAKQEKLEQGGDRRVKPAGIPLKPPFSLPAHWAIQSFENIFLFIDYRGNTPPKTEDGIPLITAKNIRMGYLDREPREFVSPATYKSWMTRGFPKVGDLFFTTEAPLGNVCLNDIDEAFAIAQRTICLQPYGKANTSFLAMAIMSRSMQRVIDEAATGMTARGIKAAKLKIIPLPIPPAAEQERIVAKVDALMALCDDLKGRITDTGQTQMRLAHAIVERAAA